METTLPLGVNFRCRRHDAVDRTSGRHPSHPALGAVTSGSMLHWPRPAGTTSSMAPLRRRARLRPQRVPGPPAHEAGQEPRLVGLSQVGHLVKHPR